MTCHKIHFWGEYSHVLLGFWLQLNLCSFVYACMRLVQVCLEQSFIIFLGQRALREQSSSQRALGEHSESIKIRVIQLEPKIRRLVGEMMASSIKKLSECPVCFVEMISPMKIYQCLNGHSLCENCKDNEHVTTCPSCRVTLRGDSISRNILAESLIEAATKQGHSDDNDISDDLIPSAPSMESVNQSCDEEDNENISCVMYSSLVRDTKENEHTLATYHFNDLLKYDCIVITSTGPASHQKGLKKLKDIFFLVLLTNVLQVHALEFTGK